MNEKQGYDVLDGKALCEEQHQEAMERDMKVRGMMYPDPEKDENIGGFLPRNNVRDRL